MSRTIIIQDEIFKITTQYISGAKSFKEGKNVWDNPFAEYSQQIFHSQWLNGFDNEEFGHHEGIDIENN